MNDLVLLAKALADPTRVRVLAALRGQELCVCELADAMELSLSTLSTHLQTIRQAGVLSTRREGKWVYYAIEAEHAGVVEVLFTHFAAALAPDRRLRRDAERVAQRLQLRQDGCCLLGFGQLGKPKGGEKNNHEEKTTDPAVGRPRGCRGVNGASRC